MEILDPTAERDASAATRATAPRPAAGTPLRIALVDILKPRGDVFLDELATILAADGHRIERTSKPTFTKPAPPDVRREIAERSDAVIEALAD